MPGMTELYPMNYKTIMRGFVKERSLGRRLPTLRSVAAALAALALLAAASAASAQDSTRSTRTTRFTDALRGFSLDAPPGAVTERPTMSPELVRFTLAPEVGRWATVLSVLRCTEVTGEFDRFEEFVAALAATLAREESFAPEMPPGGPRQVVIAGRPAVLLAGPAGPASQQRFRCDAWIHLGGHDYLVLQAAGSMEGRGRIEALLNAAAAGLEIFDPEQARRQLMADLQQGAALLATLAPADAATLGLGEDLWFVILRQERPRGFIRVRSRPDDWRDNRGLRTQILSAIRLDPPPPPATPPPAPPAPPAPPVEAERVNAAYENCFWAPGQTLERWELSFIAGGAGGAGGAETDLATGLTALRQQDVLLLEHAGGSRDGLSDTVNLPAEGFALPRALAWCPARLMQLRGLGEAGRRAAFALYNTASEQLDMRTIEARGPVQLDLAGRSYAAWLYADTPALGERPTLVYLDAAGVPLKMEAPDGEVVQRTTAAAVQTLFKKELGMIRVRP